MLVYKGLYSLVFVHCLFCFSSVTTSRVCFYPPCICVSVREYRKPQLELFNLEENGESFFSHAIWLGLKIRHFWEAKLLFSIIIIFQKVKRKFLARKQLFYSVFIFAKKFGLISNVTWKFAFSHDAFSYWSFIMWRWNFTQQKGTVKNY